MNLCAHCIVSKIFTSWHCHFGSGRMAFKFATLCITLFLLLLLLRDFCFFIMDEGVYLGDSDDEGLAGLTQVPSQINLEKDASDESDGGLDELFSDEAPVSRAKSVFGLIPAIDLKDSSQNKTVHFDSEVFAIGMDSQVSQCTQGDDDHDDVGTASGTNDTNVSGDTASNDMATSIARNIHYSQEPSTSSVSPTTASERPYVVETEDISDDEIVRTVEGIEGNLSSTSPPLHEEFVLNNKKSACNQNKFKPPRSAADMLDLSKLQVKRATKSKIDWAVRAYERWRNYRRKMFVTSKLPEDRRNRLIRPMKDSITNVEEIQDDICNFIAEVQKETGEDYPPCSLYDLVFMLSLHAEREYNSKRFITDCFPRIKNTLDGLMKERTEQGLGLVRSKDIITEEHEEILWQKGILGESNPDQLRQTVMFLIGIKFGLRGGQEHRSLRRYPFSQLNFEVKDGADCLVYRERHSKMFQGGIKKRNVREPKVVYAFCSGYRPRCLLELYEKYQFYCPRPSFHLTAFYLQTNPNWEREDFWYLRRPVGKNTLANYVKDMMQTAGIPGNFSNHSLRGTTASRLYQKNVDEQLICEQTGHRSTAVRRYKRTSLALKEQVSDLLNVLPPGVKKCSSVLRPRDQQVESSDDESPPKKSKTTSNVEFVEDKVDKVSKANAKCVVKSSTKKVGATAVNVTEHENSKPPVAEGSSTGGVVVMQEDPKDPINVHIPVSQASSLQGLVNIHFHFASK